VEDYFHKYALLRKRLETEGPAFYSAETIIEVLSEEFNRTVAAGPPQIYGEWDKLFSVYGRLSSLYFNPEIEDPIEIGPRKDLLISGDIWPFTRKHHTECLWFIEKDRYLLSGIKTDVGLTVSEKQLKDKALSFLYRGDRDRGFTLLKQAVSRFPDDFTLYGDIAFLYLNDRKDTRTAMINLETASRLIAHKKSSLYCFIRLAVNVIHNIEDDRINAYSVTKTLVDNFPERPEILYQHAINSLNASKRDEGLQCLKQALQKDINYALKAYEEVEEEEYKSELSEMFYEFVYKKEKKFTQVNARTYAVVNEARAMGIDTWGAEIMQALQPDIDIINTLGNSKIYVHILAAEYFTYKTPYLLIEKAGEKLVKSGNLELEENKRRIEMTKETVRDKINEYKRYNLIGIPFLGSITTIMFIVFSVREGFLFAAAFSTVFAAIVLVGIGLNTFKINTMKSSAESEVNKLKVESEEIVQIYREEMDAFSRRIRSLVDI